MLKIFLKKLICPSLKSTYHFSFHFQISETGVQEGVPTKKKEKRMLEMFLEKLLPLQAHFTLLV